MFENSFVKCIVRRERYKKNRAFHYHDHTYDLIFQKKDPTRADFRLLSCLKLIENSVAATLQILRTYYTKRSENAADTDEGRLFRMHSHQAYICVASKQFR